MKQFYKTTTPLFPVGAENSSTASISCYYGKNSQGGDNIYFVEITDCRRKVEIHKQKEEDLLDFIEKLKTIMSELMEFVLYLEDKGRNEEVENETENK